MIQLVNLQVVFIFQETTSCIQLELEGPIAINVISLYTQTDAPMIFVSIIGLELIEFGKQILAFKSNFSDPNVYSRIKNSSLYPSKSRIEFTAMLYLVISISGIETPDFYF